MKTERILKEFDNVIKNKREQTEKKTVYYFNDLVFTIHHWGDCPTLKITDTSKVNIISYSRFNIYIETIKRFGISYDTIYITTYSGNELEILYRYE